MIEWVQCEKDVVNHLWKKFLAKRDFKKEDLLLLMHWIDEVDLKLIELKKRDILG